MSSTGHIYPNVSPHKLWFQWRNGFFPFFSFFTIFLFSNILKHFYSVHSFSSIMAKLLHFYIELTVIVTFLGSFLFENCILMIISIYFWSLPFMSFVDSFFFHRLFFYLFILLIYYSCLLLKSFSVFVNICHYFMVQCLFFSLLDSFC